MAPLYALIKGELASLRSSKSIEKLHDLGTGIQILVFAETHCLARYKTREVPPLKASARPVMPTSFYSVQQYLVRP